MGLFEMLLTVVSALGVIARLLPASVCALPFAANVVALTPWFAILAALSLVLTFVPGWRKQRAWRRFVCILALACLALEVTWQMPFFVPSARVTAAREANAGQTDASASSLTVMTCNVYKGNADAVAIVALVRERGVQVLTLQETTAEFVEQLEAAGINELLPYSERSSSDGVYGNGVWSAYPLADGASDDIGSSASAMPAGTISLTQADGTTARLRFVSVHTCSPSAGYWDLWKRSIDELGVIHERLAADSATSYVLMGDFNASYDHAPFRELLGQGSATELYDAARESGQGLAFTWPANKGVPAFAAIDHVVTSEGVTATDVSVANIAGTDHLALIATLAVS